MTLTPFPNQPPPFEGRNLFCCDALLLGAAKAHGLAEFDAALRAWGDTLGTPQVAALADDANRHPPRLRTHDAAGERIDEVEFILPGIP